MRKIPSEHSGYFANLNGLIDLSRGQYASALHHFNAALSANPKNFLYYERRACTNLLLGNVEDAIKDVEAHTKFFRPVYQVFDADSCLIIKCFCLFIGGYLEGFLGEARKFRRYGQYRMHYRVVSYLNGLALIKVKMYEEALAALMFAVDKINQAPYGELPKELHYHSEELINYLSSGNFDSANKIGILNISQWRSFFRDVAKDCEYAVKKSDKNFGQPANYQRIMPAIFNEKTCGRCQMSPCHCSDPDFD